MRVRLTKRQQKKLFGLALALVLIGLSYLQQSRNATSVLGTISPGFYKVTDFADGDTITIDMDGQSETIRFIGVDTPETHDPRKAVQCYGQAAADFTRQLISANPVRLESDPFSTNRDRYNRLLRYVYLPDGQLVQAKIIREGYGFAYTSFPFSKSDDFKKLETEARQQKRGLWGTCQPKLNDNGGYTSNDE